MNNIKNVFSIKDLENLSGIKAHTIRIWEKRYNILAPMRTDTNIRYYDLASLQKLLNITLLHNHGYKISKISLYPDEKIPVLVNEIISRKSVGLHAINAFKMAMMNFDQKLFITTYNTLLAEKSFPEIFYQVIIPLLDDVGALWQTNTITPAHEHFISYLIRQKILIHTEKIQADDPTRTDKTFVLFLPLNEIHELGLMYINYEIISKGYQAIYLGGNVPIESLNDIRRYFDNIVYISYFTVAPLKEHVDQYVSRVTQEILDDGSEFWLLGRNTADIDAAKLPENTRTFSSIEMLTAEL
jgi:DNA-binding transcriptional MerR regulator